MQIIPAIDLIDGKCVRLYQGDYAQKIVYDDDPVAVALVQLGLKTDPLLSHQHDVVAPVGQLLVAHDAPGAHDLVQDPHGHQVVVLQAPGGQRPVPRLEDVQRKEGVGEEHQTGEGEDGKLHGFRVRSAGCGRWRCLR